MTLDRLKWLAVLAPFLVLIGVELVRQTTAPTLFTGWTGFLVLAAGLLLASMLFAEVIFGGVNRLQASLAQRNQELLVLHDASLAIVGEHNLETVLQLVVDRARDLVGARYGALSLVRDEGGIEAFLTAGITDEERAILGAPPEGHGILGVVLQDGATLRLADLTRDPRSVGFPPHHPPMHSLLAVPVISQGNVLGNLYLTEKLGARSFDEHDEESLKRFATLAALAIENARLHRQVQALAVTEERERIAREMHDSLAQVLGYVNTKAQATEVLIASGQNERAMAQLAQMADAARAAYADVREGILGLRVSPAGQRSFIETLTGYLEQWQGQSGVAVALVLTPANTAIRLTPNAEVQLLRIIQEALTNVRKHAGATAAEVRLQVEDGWLEASIVDNGAGFTPDSHAPRAAPRFGLSTMHERAESIGGALDIVSTPGEGTQVIARVPLDALPPGKEILHARTYR
ncbi:MAG: GAF domain-containing sensor histidine kinase [Thermomicrobiales bacterium]|nr:GAF domain-containing sensor histidine kinase [Thermomicrobiales bacterium]